MEDGFQFTPLHEGRQKKLLRTKHPKLFQFTPLHEGRHWILEQMRQGKQFQFTPLHEGRRRTGRLPHRCHGNFNSRPCTRGDVEELDKRWLSPISIHAPARGATLNFVHSFKAALFQFTPLHEGRLHPESNQSAFPYFNSRPCTRGDVSRRFCCTASCNFNSRPCTRGDYTKKTVIRFHRQFQFTPLHEGRHVGADCPLDIEDFNSRPCTRGDDRNILIYSLHLISIHAPARGATIKLSIYPPFIIHFNSRPCTRGDR